MHLVAKTTKWRMLELQNGFDQQKSRAPPRLNSPCGRAYRAWPCAVRHSIRCPRSIGLNRAICPIRFAAGRATIGEAGLAWLQFEFLSTDGANFNGKWHSSSIVKPFGRFCSERAGYSTTRSRKPRKPWPPGSPCGAQSRVVAAVLRYGPSKGR